MAAGTIILNVIGEGFDVDEKVPLSFKTNGTFESETARLKQKLGFDLKGMALYRCEGEKPFVRPTVPFSWKSTPVKEKFKRGDFIFLKEADLERQRKDVEFQEALMDFRASRGYQGPQPELADIEEFRDELATKLNAIAARDVTKFESERREKVEGEEFRSYRDITIEFREKQELKNKEVEMRQRLMDEAQGTIDAAFRRLIVGPRVTKLLVDLAGTAEPTARKAIAAEEEGDGKTLRTDASVSKQTIELRESKAKMEVEAAQRHADLMKQQQEMLLASQQAAAAAAANNSNSSNGGGGSLSAEQMSQIALLLANGGGGGSRSGADPALQDLLKNIEARLNAQSAASSEMMRALLRAHNDASERLLAITKRSEEDLLTRHRQRIEDFDRVAKRAAFSATLTESETQAVTKLMNEQNAILAKLVALDEQSIKRSEDVIHRAHESALAGVVGVITDMQSRLSADVERLERSRVALERRVEEVSIQREARRAAEIAASSAVAASPTNSGAAAVASTEVPPPQAPASSGEVGTISLSGGSWRLGHRQGVRRVMAAVIHKYELGARCGYGSTLLGAMQLADAILEQCRGSAWDAVDCIAEHVQISTSQDDAIFKRLRDVCDTHAPALRCTLPLLWDLYHGREAELCDALISEGLGMECGGLSSSSASAAPTSALLSKSLKYLAVRDASTGELRFAHPIVSDITQPLRPHAYDG